MKRLLIGVLALVACGGAIHAAVPDVDAEVMPQLEPVKSIPALTGLHSWRAIDDHRLIVWATPFDPYLVELAYPSRDLRFARAIGITSFGSRVHARFDAIKVSGMSYPISNIYRLDREEARSNTLKW